MERKSDRLPLAHFYGELIVEPVFSVSPFGRRRRMTQLHTLSSQKRGVLEMDRVAGRIEVSLTDESPEVIMRYPAYPSDAKGTHEIVIMPRHARHLANLLIEYADAAEADTGVKERSPVPEERHRFVQMSFRAVRHHLAQSKRST
jgi:hypothetical protein